MKKLLITSYILNILLIAVIVGFFASLYIVHWSGAQFGNTMMFNLDHNTEQGYGNRLMVGVHETGHFIYNTCLNETMKETNHNLYLKYGGNQKYYMFPDSLLKENEWFAQQYSESKFTNDYWHCPLEVRKFQTEVSEVCP